MEVRKGTGRASRVTKSEKVLASYDPQFNKLLNICG